MKKGISKAQKTSSVLAVITAVIGIVLMTYMITIEGEPGALPLFLILAGAGGFLVSRLSIRRQTQ